MRVVACASSSVIGSRGSTSKAACATRGQSPRTLRPRAARSATPGWATSAERAAAGAGPGGASSERLVVVIARSSSSRFHGTRAGCALLRYERAARVGVGERLLQLAPVQLAELVDRRRDLGPRGGQRGGDDADRVHQPCG